MWKRTKKSLVTAMYFGQRTRSTLRGHHQPTYTKEELRDWLFSQKLFHILYDNWKRLDYQKNYIPSVDRINDYIGYTMDNIQLMTWKENRAKHDKDRKEGINNKMNKAVRKYTKDGYFIEEYYSISEAGRANGINISNIARCCKYKRESAGGFVWRY